MLIKKLKASFGRLQGEELALHEGLNIIQAPNESGKSTWSHFIRAMFYGVNTSERSRNGSVPDKTRFRPWGNVPMQGTMDILWHDREITLTRAAMGGDKPMGNCFVTYTGTGEKIPELMGKNTGEIMLGMTEPVFRRSAFITGSEIPVDKDIELEKKITALVTSGEEDCSYTDADDRLRRWQRKRRFRSDGGRLPEAENRLREVSQALRNIESENNHLAVMRENIEKLEKRKELLELEARRHNRDEKLEARQKVDDAVKTYTEIQEKVETLKKEIGGASDSDIKALEAENSKLDIHKKVCIEASKVHENAEKELLQLPMAVTEDFGKKGLMSVICFTLAFICCIIAPIAHLRPLLVPAAVLTIIGAVLLILRSKAVSKVKSERASAREIAEYKVKAAKERFDVAAAEVKKSEESISHLMKKLGAMEGESPEAVSLRISEAISGYERAVIEADAAARHVEFLKELCTGDIDPIEGETKLSKADAENYLKQTVNDLEKTERELARGEGSYCHLGDPLLLSTEEKRLAEEIVELEKEYKALELAIYTLKEANSKLQSLFSPLISREAGRLMSRMTSGEYKGVYFDRDMHFSAARTEDVAAHELEYLSDGTKNQLYLAIRLAFCRVALTSPEGEACPIILDGVLDSFDDGRAEQALYLLKEIADNEKRQIILFTCHSREKRLFENMKQGSV